MLKWTGSKVDILGIILPVLKEVADTNGIEIPNLNENTPLYGSNGYLDSISLVTFIIGIEQKLSALGYSITIASEKAFSRNLSPFSSVKTLGRFIKKLIKDSRDRDK